MQINMQKNMQKNMLYKKYDKIRFIKNIFYYFFDLYYRVKYFAYFNLFLNFLFFNYVYYKFFGVINNNLLLLLNYSIKCNGCIIIKLVQWLNNQLQFLKNDSKNPNYNNNILFITKLFSCYYENCNVHNLNYTKSLFFKEFGYLFDDVFVLDKSFKIKSGSVAQVYKAYIKNYPLYKKIYINQNVNNFLNNGFNSEFDLSLNLNIAIKVVHPELEYQMLYPIYFINIYSYFTNNVRFFKKYNIIFNFDSFFCNLKKQINMVNEYENNIYYYNKYKDSRVIIIPKPLLKSNNFLVMEYVEGEFLEKLNIGEYKKQIIISLISLFLKDTYIFGKYIHCDLHDANWKIKKSMDSDELYKIIIYDFGYVIENKCNEDIKNLIYYLDINNTYELGKILFKNIQNFKYNSNNIIIDCSSQNMDNFVDDFVKYNKSTYPYTDNNIISVYNFCYENGYKLKNNLLDLFVSIMLLQKYFKKYIYFDLNNNNFCLESYNKHIYNINLFYISICEKFDIFYNVKEYIYQRYIDNSLLNGKNIYNNKYFESLDNNINNIDI